jgi:hypothetical protein
VDQERNITSFDICPIERERERERERETYKKERNKLLETKWGTSTMWPVYDMPPTYDHSIIERLDMKEINLKSFLNNCL